MIKENRFMQTEILVSYVHEDIRYLNKIKKWAKRNKFGDFSVKITTPHDSSLKTKTGKIIRGKIRQKIKETAFVIIIVGENSRRHPWLRWESFAKERNTKRFYMRIPYTKGALPFQMQQIPQMAYNPNAVEKMLREIFEGKEQESNNSADLLASDEKPKTARRERLRKPIRRPTINKSFLSPPPPKPPTEE